jgi:hypothetical protein
VGTRARAAAGGAGAARWRGTMSHSTEMPKTANTKLVAHMMSKLAGNSASTVKASSGPNNAPPASRPRCTAKAVARAGVGVLSDISASRGAARMPLPARSRPTISAIQPQAAVNMSASLQIADSP